MRKRTNRRRTALLLGALLAVALLLSAALTIGHAGHCCRPQACPVCIQIDVMRGVLKLLLLALAALLPWLSRVVCKRRGCHSPGLFLRSVTPITLNIRMNN